MKYYVNIQREKKEVKFTYADMERSPQDMLGEAI